MLSLVRLWLHMTNDMRLTLHTTGTQIKLRHEFLPPVSTRVWPGRTGTLIPEHAALDLMVPEEATAAKTDW